MFKKSILFIIILSFNLFSQSGVHKLKSDIQKILNDRLFEHSQIAIDIYDLTEGKTLYKENEKLLLHPASNMKLLTSAAGLIFLGGDYTFKTSLYHSGVISGDTLYGSIFVEGGLDPDFTTTDLDSMIRSISLLGIKHITENLYADISIKDSLYWGRGWMWDDDPDPSAPYLSALNINDNSIEIFVEGSKIDSPAAVSLTPQTNYVNVINKSITVPQYEENNFEITRDWINRTNDIIIEGDVRAGTIIDSSDFTEKVNLLYPEKYFLTLMREHLDSIGITVGGGIKISKLPGNVVFLNFYERRLDSVLVNLNKESDNLSAEMLLYALALNDSGAPASAKNGIGAINNLIDSVGLNPEDYTFADGSGVSRYNLVSAELLTELLKYMYYARKDLFDIYYSSLPVAGMDGTLEKRMNGTKAENNVHAKTGTIAGVSDLSGYVTARNSHLIAFSILIQNFLDETKKARSIEDKICNLLTNYK
ncbi:D-alanyl-D-alanine carboxypeptidase DacC precursor [bacterium BMS3Abin03]|nr:D-alanyl-D-alanine carboxypeptidase DacC precursor [bacterium BMS3Abin03]